MTSLPAHTAATARRVMVGLDRAWFAPAPPSRLAVLRLTLGLFSLHYLWRRRRMFERVVATDPGLFKPVGVVSPLRRPLAPSDVRATVFATLLANVAFVLGLRHRVSGPLFGGLLLWLLSYRNSWSMVYHSDNPLVLHAIVLGLTPAADALSLDAMRRSPAGVSPHWRYGWPIRLINAATALIYLLAGVAKLAGPMGWRWASGDALRSHIAVDGLRKELLGAIAPGLPRRLNRFRPLFHVMAASSLVLELGAPLALLHPRLGQLWAVAAWLMHWGIYAMMGISFRYQMSGLLFVPFFVLGRLRPRAQRRGA